jgi:hypothetical protein
VPVDIAGRQGNIMSDRSSAARLLALSVFVILGVRSMPACDADGGDAADGGGGGEGGGEVGGHDGGGASAEDQSRCKDSCNQLKFFNCNDAADHAACFLACESAPESAIEVFIACVETDICDAECAADLVGEAHGSEGEGEGGGSEGGGEEGGSEPTSCTEACAEFVGAGCVPPVDCAGFCSSLSEFEQTFVGYCVDRRDGCELPEECADALAGNEGGGAEEGGQVEEGGGGEVGGGEVGGGEVGGLDPIEQCQGTCDDMQFFSCIDASQHSSCRELCTTASTERIDTFVGCAFGCQDDACYVVFADG